MILETRGLSNYFGKICTAENLDFAIEEGVLTSIIGPNGAGKSTLINLLTGYLPVQTGKVFFKGKEITRYSVHKRVRQGICRSFQIVNVFPQLTVAQNVMIPILSLAGRSWSPFAKVSAERDAQREAEEILKRVELSAERDTPASALSHGDQRLLEVGVALAARPTLLFLDEPTAGMNPVERSRLLEDIRRLAREGKTTFVVVEHDMDVVFALSERIVVLHRGVIIGDGPPEEIRNDKTVKEVYLGEDVSDLFRYEQGDEKG
ncbi:MAG TPA: ABC transporter ATP-binding protein [Candidatus Deferrimicrobiaceae bacterium]|nr:ABC transporter ATP-binding protein [Candidatus Deferrimicrobiaceae bacterium]